MTEERKAELRIAAMNLAVKSAGGGEPVQLTLERAKEFYAFMVGNSPRRELPRAA